MANSGQPSDLTVVSPVMVLPMCLFLGCQSTFITEFDLSSLLTLSSGSWLKAARAFSLVRLSLSLSSVSHDYLF